MRLTPYLAVWISVGLLLVAQSRAEEDHHKRVPQGFTGVRGKKSIPDDAYNIDFDGNDLNQHAASTGTTTTSSPISYAVEKRALSGFFGMRGKKPWNFPSDEMYKRAPWGFVGMRGKKEDEDDDEEEEEEKRGDGEGKGADNSEIAFDEPPKRGARMGFFGMRGKKYYVERPSAAEYIEGKRAPMGFVGMRGKKDFEESKRAAPSGFFGMRGKKQPYGFLGVRGKKYPYEFRGKFVGVRGKKSLDVVAAPRDYYSDTGLDINQLMLLLTEQNEADSSRQ